MSAGQPMDLSEIKIDVGNLFREDTFTDLQVGSIRRLTPVKADGSEDASRETIYTGHTSVMSRMGALPIECAIEAETLDEAIDKFPKAVQAAFERMIDAAREQQREMASRIVVPETRPGGGIQMP